MGYLLTQMSLYMLATFILGLILGWLLWRYGQTSGSDIDALQKERQSLLDEKAAWEKERVDLNTNLDSCRNRSTRERQENDELRAEIAALQATSAAAPVAGAAAVAAPAKVAVTVEPGDEDRPAGLSAPRGGKADDLKEISGVGPKMENLLHSLGFYHFDQIAAWSPSEVAWVDANLEGFKGRVTRDNWIDQAKVLAKG